MYKRSLRTFFKDHRGFFLNRLNILEAKIHTWDNGIALDIFYVEDLTKDIELRLENFKNDLEKILLDKINLKQLISKNKDAYSKNKRVVPNVKPEVNVSNDESDFSIKTLC